MISFSEGMKVVPKLLKEKAEKLKEPIAEDNPWAIILALKGAKQQRVRHE